MNETPLSELTQTYHILLGSKSPRRKELLKQLCIPFDVVNIEVEETYPADMLPTLVPQYLSGLKFEGYREKLQDNELLITADTIVINDGKILGKPHNASEAMSMLTALSNRTHEVITGVTLGSNRHRIGFSVESKVTFGSLTPEEIAYYVNKFHPLDKAGAYGIQEWIGCVAIESIQGSFYNVMGLPTCRLYHELRCFRFQESV